MDLVEMFNELPADRAMNVIDSILIEEAVRDGHAEGGIEKSRTRILSIYNQDPEEIDRAEDEFFNGSNESNHTPGTFAGGMKVNNTKGFQMEAPANDVGDGASPFDRYDIIE